MIHPDFKPLPFLHGGHRQTLAAFLFKGKRRPYQAVQHVFDLDQGDRTILHDDCPAGWTDGGPVALLLHGLAGCHGSDYMVRCLLYTSPSPRDKRQSRMPSSA